MSDSNAPTDTAQQDALSNAFLGVFGIAVVLMAQLGLGGIERRAFEAVYGSRADYQAIQKTMTPPTPACVIGAKPDVSGVTFVITNGPLKLESLTNAVSAIQWQEDASAPALQNGGPMRYLFELQTDAMANAEWRMTPTGGSTVDLVVLADERMLTLKRSSLSVGETWVIRRVAGGISVREEGCP